MNTALTILVAAAAVAAIGLSLWTLLRVYLKFQGTRVVTCPESGKKVAVEVDAKHAALGALVGDPGIRLRDCTRWPERRDCGQQCLAEIEAAPADCLVRTIAQNWYAGKNCALCGKPIGRINWLAHPPGLMSSDGSTVTWDEVPAETIHEQLATHRPVCWNCHIAESFRHEHPDLVVDRPDRTHVNAE